jgi:hypothetical protein
MLIKDKHVRYLRELRGQELIAALTTIADRSAADGGGSVVPAQPGTTQNTKT